MSIKNSLSNANSMGILSEAEMEFRPFAVVQKCGYKTNFIKHVVVAAPLTRLILTLPTRFI